MYTEAVSEHFTRSPLHAGYTGDLTGLCVTCRQSFCRCRVTVNAVASGLTAGEGWNRRDDVCDNNRAIGAVLYSASQRT